MSNPKTQFCQEFDRIVKAHEDSIEGKGNNQGSKWDDLLGLLKRDILVDPEEVHVFKLRSNSVDNCLWEGAPLWKRFRLGVALVPTALRENKPRQTAAFADAVVNRMYPRPNGFDTIAICVPQGDGWVVSEIVGDKDSTIAVRLGKEFPNAVRTESARPVSPGTTHRMRSDYQPADQLVSAISEHLLESLNVILQGPPGTGKTHLAKESISFLAGEPASSLTKYEFEHLLQRSNGNFEELLAGDDTESVIWERVQLHPNYSYEDLVRGMAAQSVNGHMVFEPEDKLLVQLALLAEKRPKTKVIVLLDEVNRCNLSSVLGELIFAIEPGARGVPVRMQYGRSHNSYSSDVLALPRNLLFLGTMNTADRSIGLVDYAIRRRFRFLDIGPNASVIERYYAHEPKRCQRAVELFNIVNGSVRERNLQLGHSYFLAPASSQAWSDSLADRFFFEVVPMLREYAAEGRAVTPTLRVADITISTGPSVPEDDRLGRDNLIKWLKA